MKSTNNTLVLERGILTSSYKEEIKQNIKNMRSESLSRVKNRVKNQSTRFTSQTATALKVSMFTLALVMMIL